MLLKISTVVIVGCSDDYATIDRLLHAHVYLVPVLAHDALVS
jgi:hypothetical protein